MTFAKPGRDLAVACYFAGVMFLASSRTRTIVTIALIGAAGVAGCRTTPLNTSLQRLLDAGKLAADLEVQFTKTGDAANRAVMADTDETSVAFAREAEQATQAVEKDSAALRPLLTAFEYLERAPPARRVRPAIRRISQARSERARPGRREHQPQGSAPLVRSRPASGRRISEIARRACACQPGRQVSRQGPRRDRGGRRSRNPGAAGATHRRVRRGGDDTYRGADDGSGACCPRPAEDARRPCRARHPVRS